MARDDFKNLGFQPGEAGKTNNTISSAKPDEKEKGKPGELRW